jgi:hypothetical protein
MPLPAKALRTQLAMLRPVVRSMSLKSVRKWQNVIGGLMEARYKNQIIVKQHDFGRFSGAWVMPGGERRQGGREPSQTPKFPSPPAPPCPPWLRRSSAPLAAGQVARELGAAAYEQSRIAQTKETTYVESQ